MGKGILTGLVLLLCAFCAQAQNNVPVSQSPPDKSVPLLFEKTYLHTDRDVYAQGDTLWFKAYLVNAQDNKPVNSSKTLYVELIAPDSAKIVVREIIRLEQGLGKGDITLDSLKAGHYRLRAYTNWMRNFGDNFVFEKDITLLDESTSAASATPHQTAFTAPKKSTTIAIPAAAIITTTGPTIRFYPEGGSLVSGISSMVGVKAEDASGKGIPVSGTILSASGDTVSRFSCDSLGMGLFALLPIAGQNYRALAGNNSYAFPSALSKGLALQVRQSDTTIHAIVSSSDTAAGCLLSIKHTGTTILSRQLQISKQLALKIPTATLPEGISAITLYNAQGRPECERLVYIHHPDKDQSKVTISTNKKSYAPKEQVMVSITAAPNSSLSMAVVDADMVPVQPENIVAYLNLQSELRGTIENPNRYFDSTNTDRAKQLDELLLTQGWRDFVWRRLADTAIRISYAAENGITVSGRIRDEVLNKMLPGLNLTLYAPGAQQNKMLTASSDSQGRFHFDGAILYGKQTVTLSAVNEKGEKKGSFMVDTLPPMPVLKKEVQFQPFVLTPAGSVAMAAMEKRSSQQRSKLSSVTRLKQVDIAVKRSMISRNGSILVDWGPDQVFNIKPEDEQYKTLEWYLQQNTKGAVKPNTDPNRMIAPIPPSIDRTVSAEEYNREVREFMRPLTGLAYMGVDTFLVTSWAFDKRLIYSWRPKMKPIPPNLIVNGQELYMDEYEQAEAYRTTYFNMPINKFKKVVLKHMTGTLHGSGTPAAAQNITVDRYLLYLTLKDNAMIDNPGSTNAYVDGYYQARTFYEPKPGDKPSLNDYRSTIHWAPDIKTDATGKATVSFYNAVPQGKIRLVAEGITQNGTPLTATSSYEIK